MPEVRKYIPILVLMLLLPIQPTVAQEPPEIERSENKVILEGRIYYIHVVKAGQTLYSIARAYQVSEKEIIMENPGSGADLMIGQVLKIPSRPSVETRVHTADSTSQGAYHVMKAGETLYAISRRYGCSVDELIRLNPGLDINDIPNGYKIRLPGEESRADISFDDEGFLFHKVKKGETLFSISRYYDVGMKDIRSENPELGWGGPRIGDILRIPKPNTSVTSIFSPDTVKKDTLFMAEEIDSLAIEDLYAFDDFEDFVFDSGRMYRVVYLIPFNYEEMVPLDTLLKDVKSEIRRERIIQDYKMEAAKPGSTNFLEFLEGSMLAADSLTDVGMSLDIRVYDTKRSMIRTQEILEDPAVREADLIIGPFYNYNLELVSAFSRRHRIPLVTPFSANDSLLRKNPYLFQPMPSHMTEFRRNAVYIGRLLDKNLVFVHNGDSARALSTEAYKETIFSEIAKYADPETVMFKEVVITDGNTDGLVHALNQDMENLVILPSTDEAFASLVATRIYYELGNYDIALFGSSYWVGFNNIEISYPHALDLTISHRNIYNYTDREFLDFLEKFRNNYMKEPLAYTLTGCNYGVTGYDLSLYFLSALHRYGPRFVLHMQDHREDATLCMFDFDRVSPRGGFENRYMRYYHYGQDLEIAEANLPEKPELYRHFLPAGEDPIYLRWSEPKPDTTIILEDE